MEEQITKGPWDEKWIRGALRHLRKNVDWDLFFDGEIDGDVPREVDATNIACVPELIQVYKTAKEALLMMEDWCSDMEGEDKGLIYSGLEAIKELEKKTGRPHA